MKNVHVLVLVGLLSTGCTTFQGFPWSDKAKGSKLTTEPVIAVAVKPQPEIEIRTEKKGVFNIRVWDYYSFSQQLRNKVDAERRCQLRAGCKRSETIKQEIAVCAEKGTCKLSSSVVWFKLNFNGASVFDAQHAVTGKEALNTTFGTTIVAEAIPDSCAIVIPYFTYVLYPEGWGEEMGGHEEVRHVYAHYVLKCAKKVVAKPPKKMETQKKKN